MELIFEFYSNFVQVFWTLYDAIDCSTPGFPVLHCLSELAQTHAHWVNDTIQPSHPLSPSYPTALNIFQHPKLFQWGHLFTSGGQSIGASASASILPMNIQDWFPLGWTGWISLQSKGLSRFFSNYTVQSINSLVLSFLYSPTVTSIHDYWKNHSFPSLHGQ